MLYVIKQSFYVCQRPTRSFRCPSKSWWNHAKKKTCREISKDFLTPEHVDISNSHFWYTMKAEIKKLPVVLKIKERTALAGFGLAAVFAHKNSGKGGKLTQCNVNFHPPVQQFLVHEKRQVTMAAVSAHEI